MHVGLCRHTQSHTHAHKSPDIYMRAQTNTLMHTIYHSGIDKHMQTTHTHKQTHTNKQTYLRLLNLTFIYLYTGIKSKLFETLSSLQKRSCRPFFNSFESLNFISLVIDYICDLKGARLAHD